MITSATMHIDTIADTFREAGRVAQGYGERLAAEGVGQQDVVVEEDEIELDAEVPAVQMMKLNPGATVRISAPGSPGGASGSSSSTSTEPSSTPCTPTCSPGSEP